MEKKKYGVHYIHDWLIIDVHSNYDKDKSIELTEEEYQTYLEVLERFEYWQNRFEKEIK